MSVPRPLAIRLFALLFGLSLLCSVGLALYSANTMAFGFPMTSDAAATLTKRILIIRLAGAAFAIFLMLLIVFARSRAARSALVVRWLLSAATSVVFLRAVGLVHPAGASDMLAMAASSIQLTLEALAILVLFGEDAGTWFERRSWA